MMNFSTTLPPRCAWAGLPGKIFGASSPRNLKSNLGSPQCRLDQENVIGWPPAFSQKLAGAFLSGSRPLDVDFFGTLRGIRENEDAIVANLEESPADGQVDFVRAFPNLKSAWLESRQQSRVPRQDPQFP